VRLQKCEKETGTTKNYVGVEFSVDRRLFYVGQKWARYAGRSRLLIGSAMVALGLMLVGIAILFPKLKMQRSNTQ
jgi:hypothetical protein